VGDDVGARVGPVGRAVGDSVVGDGVGATVLGANDGGAVAGTGTLIGEGDPTTAVAALRVYVQVAYK